MKIFMPKAFSEWVVNIIGAALLLAMMILTPGCTSTKEVNKSYNSKDSTKIAELERQIITFESTIETLQQQIREHQFSSVEFDKVCDTLIKYIERNGCDSSVVNYLKSKLEMAQSEVEILADGSIKAKGLLKSATVTKDKLTTLLHTSQLQIVSLTNELIKERTNVKTVMETKVVHKKTSVLNQLWLWLIIALAGIIAGKKYGSKIPLINKINYRV